MSMSGRVLAACRPVRIDARSAFRKQCEARGSWLRRSRLTLVKERHEILPHWGHMNAAVRSLLVLLNVLALCLYGFAASASAVAGMDGKNVVICGADGPETVRIETGGAPAESSHDCCKCLSCIAFSPSLLDRPSVVPTPASGAVRFDPAWATDLAFVRPMPRPLTRGPPSCPADAVYGSSALPGEAAGASVAAALEPTWVRNRSLTQDGRAMNEVAR